MAKLRKMLGKADSPYILELMNLIDTQNSLTLVNWCLAYAEEKLLPIFHKEVADDRPQQALQAIHLWKEGKATIREVKQGVKEVDNLARENDAFPAAQAAARGMGQATGSVYNPTHTLGMVFYALAAVAYDRVGTQESNQVYDAIAQEEGAYLLQQLTKIAVKDEPNPVRVKWNC